MSFGVPLPVQIFTESELGLISMYKSHMLGSHDDRATKRQRLSNRHRERVDFYAKAARYTPLQFAKKYRGSWPRFQHLLSRLRQSLASRVEFDNNKKPITEILKLGIGLRLLAGGSYQDLYEEHGIGESTIYSIFWKFCRAVNQEIKISFDSSIPNLERLATGFQSRSTAGVISACIGAIDGLLVKIKCPRWTDSSEAKRFFSRKNTYGVIVLSIFDAERRCIFLSVNAPGSCNDSMAFEFTTLFQKLEAGIIHIPKPFHFVGDNAFPQRTWMCVPMPGKISLLPSHYSAYNFYLSQLRIHSECGFGMVVRKWGIFWKPMEFKLQNVPIVIATAFKLHNFFIDETVDELGGEPVVVAERARKKGVPLSECCRAGKPNNHHESWHGVEHTDEYTPYELTDELRAPGNISRLVIDNSVREGILTAITVAAGGSDAVTRDTTRQELITRIAQRGLYRPADSAARASAHDYSYHTSADSTY
eukprot:gb/GEZN01007359.1/.p1 GENE.gb/GEZN01007359.1/~~gb/GEZN01007359.1/.p1  ORF type:complete len:501 (+),score=25.03 gb/GEZN01007359.1/:73-1503(+)